MTIFMKFECFFFCFVYCYDDASKSKFQVTSSWGWRYRE